MNTYDEAAETLKQAQCRYSDAENEIACRKRDLQESPSEHGKRKLEEAVNKRKLAWKLLQEAEADFAEALQDF